MPTKYFHWPKITKSVEKSVSSQYTLMKKWRLILLSVIIFRKLLTDNFILLKDNGELNPDTSFARKQRWNLQFMESGFTLQLVVCARFTDSTLTVQKSVQEFLRCSQIKHEIILTDCLMNLWITNLSPRITYFLDYNRAKIGSKNLNKAFCKKF